MSLGAPEVEYAIDETPVPGGPWRHRQVLRRPAGTRTEGIPGVAQHFVTTGVLMPGGITITGMLLATSHALLKAAHDTYAGYLDDLATHTVTFHDVEWTQMHLMDYQIADDVIGITDDGTHYAGQPVSFVWRQLRV